MKPAARAPLEREEVRLLLEKDAQPEELPAAQRPAFGWMLALREERILTKKPRILNTLRMRLTSGPRRTPRKRWRCGQAPALRAGRDTPV